MTERAARAIGRHAVRALYREAALAPKPGLVSRSDSGSHHDMDFGTFVRSVAALRHYFPAIARLGAQGAGFPSLQQAGRQAEARMLAATGGINTHRGGIFNLGLLCAAAGALVAEGAALEADALCDVVRLRWGAALRLAGGASADSHGRSVRRRHGCGGARAEASAGYPAAREVGLPAWRAALSRSGDPDAAAVQALFALIAELEDTNLLWRGGVDGLGYARALARGFLAAGGVHAPDWREHALDVHAAFVARRLSPGGSADLLGVTLFLAELQGGGQFGEVGQILAAGQFGAAGRHPPGQHPPGRHPPGEIGAARVSTNCATWADLQPVTRTFSADCTMCADAGGSGSGKHVPHLAGEAAPERLDRLECTRIECARRGLPAQSWLAAP